MQFGPRIARSGRCAAIRRAGRAVTVRSARRRSDASSPNPDLDHWPGHRIVPERGQFRRRADGSRHHHRAGDRQYRGDHRQRHGESHSRRDQFRAHRDDVERGVPTRFRSCRSAATSSSSRPRIFRTTTVENIEVTAGGTVRVDAQLAVGGLQDAVTVTADAKQIQTDSVKVTTAISSKFIQDLPLVVGGQLRSPLDLSLIAPEAKAGTSGDGASRQHRHRRRPGGRLGPDASTACRRRPARRSSSGCGPRSIRRRSKPSPSSRSTPTASRRSSATRAAAR